MVNGGFGVKEDHPTGLVARLEALLGLHFRVAGLVDAFDEALSTDSEDFDAASR